METTFVQLTEHQYINLETFRKNGVGVRTPVWFVQESDSLYVRTMVDSGKVKRIRNYDQVNLAPCKVDGALLGDWISASAHIVDDDDTYDKVDRLLSKKYGLMKKLFALNSVLLGKKHTILEIKVRE